MLPVPQDFLDEIDEAEAERGGAEDAANSALHVMFFMANQLETKPSMPPILYQGYELYPLPTPWAYSAPLNPDGTKNTDLLLIQVNKWLTHVKSNGIEFNKAVVDGNTDVANGIAVQSAEDSAAVWGTCNAMAESLVPGEPYQIILLADYVRDLYISVAGPFPNWPPYVPPEPPPEPEPEPEVTRRQAPIT